MKAKQLFHQVEDKGLREEVLHMAYNTNTMRTFDNYEDALTFAKNKKDNLQIFKLVAEVEKVTTVNVKEV